MADCALTPTCLFFNDKMKNMPKTASVFKHDFCRGDFRSCARFRVFEALGREHVPEDLYPNDERRASRLIR